MSKHQSTRPLSLRDEEVMRIATSVKIPNVLPETIVEIVRENFVVLKEVFESASRYEKETSIRNKIEELVKNSGSPAKRVLHPQPLELNGSSVGQSNGNNTTGKLNYSAAKDITRRLAINFLSTKHAKELILISASAIAVSCNKEARSKETLALIDKLADKGALLLIVDRNQGLATSIRRELLNTLFMDILREHLNLPAAEPDESAAPSEGESLDSSDSE